MKHTKAPAPVPAGNRPAWVYAVALAAAAYLVFQIYAPALHGPFLFDDRELPYSKVGSSLRAIAWIKGVRPLLMLSYWLNYRLDNDPFAFHVVNVVLHWLNSVLVFVIVRKLLARSATGRALSNLLASATAAVFLLHPIQTEAVAYIAGRSECMSAFFFLSAYAVFLYRRTPAIGWKTAAVVFIAYGAAVASKENTLVLPGLLLLTDYYWNPKDALAAIRRNCRIYAPLAVAGFAGTVMAVNVLFSTRSAGFSIKTFTWYQYFFTECRAFFVYLRLLILPYGQNADWDYPISSSILDRGALIAISALAALIGAAIYYRRKYPLASFGFLTYLLLLAPASSFLPILDPLAEHRLYLPVIGILLVAAAAARGLKVSRRTLAIAGGVICVLLGVATFQRNQVWATEIGFWEDAVRKSPGKQRPHFQLAFAYYTSGRCKDSIRQYDALGKLKNPDEHVLVNWGLALECGGQPDQAIEKLREASMLHPTAHVFSQIGLVYARQARWPEALDALAQAEALDPGFAMTYSYRGGVRAATGYFAAAVIDYQRALVLDSANLTASQGLAYARQQLALPRR